MGHGLWSCAALRRLVLVAPNPASGPLTTEQQPAVQQRGGTHRAHAHAPLRQNSHTRKVPYLTRPGPLRPFPADKPNCMCPVCRGAIPLALASNIPLSFSAHMYEDGTLLLKSYEYAACARS